MKLENCPFCDAEAHIDTSCLQYEEDPYLEVDHEPWCPLIGKGVLDGEEYIDPFSLDEFILGWNTRAGRYEGVPFDPSKGGVFDLDEYKINLEQGEIVVPMDLMRSFLKTAARLRTMTHSELDEILSENSNKTRTKRFLKQIPTFMKKKLKKIRKGD